MRTKKNSKCVINAVSNNQKADNSILITDYLLLSRSGTRCAWTANQIQGWGLAYPDLWRINYLPLLPFIDFNSLYPGYDINVVTAARVFNGERSRSPISLNSSRNLVGDLLRHFYTGRVGSLNSASTGFGGNRRTSFSWDFRTWPVKKGGNPTQIGLFWSRNLR